MNNSVNYVLGIDCSTKTIGVTVMDLSGKLIEMFYINPLKTSKKNGIMSVYKKIDYVTQEFQKYTDLKIKHIFIEEPLKNGPAIGTTILLAKFNGMVSQKLYELFKVEPEHLTVHECRKIFFPEHVSESVIKGVVTRVLSLPKNVDKKKVIWDKVSWIEPQFKWDYKKDFSLKIENYDMADSYVVAKAGLMKNEYITKVD